MTAKCQDFEYMELDGEISVDDILDFAGSHTLCEFIRCYENFEEYPYLVKHKDGAIVQQSKKHFETCSGEPGRTLNCERYQRHKEIMLELNEVYISKNIAYGNSFSKTFQELGPISAITRMHDKFSRVVALSTGAKNGVADESLIDSLKDLANYAVMTVMELERESRAL